VDDKVTAVAVRADVGDQLDEETDAVDEVTVRVDEEMAVVDEVTVRVDVVDEEEMDAVDEEVTVRVDVKVDVARAASARRMTTEGTRTCAYIISECTCHITINEEKKWRWQKKKKKKK
jgi:hypothetical protein